MQHEKTSTQNLIHKWKKLKLNNHAFTSTNTVKKQRCVSTFLLLCLNSIRELDSRFQCYLRSSTFFQSPQAKNTILAPPGPPLSGWINRTHYFPLRNNYGNGSGTSEDSQQWKETLKADWYVFKKSKKKLCHEYLEEKQAVRHADIGKECYIALLKLINRY